MNWEILKSKYVFLCPWLKVRKDHVRLPSRIEMEDFYIIESNDWVNVIAITEEGNFIIEEQYRHGIKRICFELPAGNVMDNEDPLEAAKRELLEETGYGGGNWKLFNISAPNASNMSNICYTFLATDLSKISEPKKEDTEDINLYFINREKLEKLLKENQFIEAVMQTPLWKYLRSK